MVHTYDTNSEIFVFWEQENTVDKKLEVEKELTGAKKSTKKTCRVDARALEGTCICCQHTRAYMCIAYAPWAQKASKFQTLLLPQTFKTNGGIGLMILHMSLDWFFMMIEGKIPFKNHKFIIPSTRNIMHKSQVPQLIYGKLSNIWKVVQVEKWNPHLKAPTHMGNMRHSTHLPCGESLRGSFWWV